MKSVNHSLRIALVWNGAIFREEIFNQTARHTVTIGDDEHNAVVLSTPGLPDSLEVFERNDKGYTLRFPDGVDGSLHINSDEYTLETLREDNRAVEMGAAMTGRGRVPLFEMRLHRGDWGVLEFGDISLFFQLVEGSDVVAGRNPRDMIDGPLTAAVAAALLLHMGALVTAFLQPPTPELEHPQHHQRMTEFDVDDIIDADDEEELDVDELASESTEDDSAESDADGDEMADEVDAVDEADTPDESDETVAEADELNVDEVGVHDALSQDAMADSAIGNVFDDSEVGGVMDLGGDDMEATGRNGAGPDIGDGSGGNRSFSEIGEPGPGDGPPPGDGPALEESGQRQVPDPTDDDDPEVGDFCQPSDIQRVVQARSQAIQHCYERRLQVDPQLSGNLTMNWRVELDGSPSNIRVMESTLNDAEVEGCVSRTIERMQFDQPDGGMCEINYPFVFSGLR